MRARSTTTLLAAVLLPLTLTGCGAGLDPQTYRERTTQDATNASIGDLQLRDVAIAPPSAGTAELAAGSDATLTLTIVSQSQDPDQLISVATPAASGVELVDGKGAALDKLEVPAAGSVSPDDFAISLHGLAAALRPGMYVDVTFTFDKNGRATFRVPVKVYDNPLPRASYSPKSENE